MAREKGQRGSLQAAAPHLIAANSLLGPELIYFLMQVALLKRLASMGSMQAEAQRITAKMAEKLLEVGLTEQTVRCTCLTVVMPNDAAPYDMYWGPEVRLKMQTARLLSCLSCCYVTHGRWFDLRSRQ